MLKADEATSQMEEGFRGKIQLLPAHQQTARASDPRVQTLHDPATRQLRGLQAAARFHF
jgi:hypothetical protein